MLAIKASIGSSFRNVASSSLLFARHVHSQAYLDSVKVLKTDLKKAMQARDDLRKTTIRALLSGIKNKEIDNQGKDLDEFTLQELYSKLITQRKDSIKDFLANDREDLVKKEKDEIEIIQGFLTQLPVSTQEEIDEKVVALLKEIQKAEPTTQLKQIFGKIDWKRVPTDWNSSPAIIRASIVSNYKDVF